VAEPHLVDGRNVVFDADGPKTGFGAEFLSDMIISDPDGFQSIQADNGDVWYFTTKGIFLFDSTTGRIVTLHRFATATTTVHRWTCAVVGSIQYIGHPDQGVLYYDAATELFETHPSGQLPNGAFAVCLSNGRLVVLGSTSYSWSAQDDGTDLTTSLTTGAGNQATSLVGGTPLMAIEFQQGFLVFTSQGIIRALFTGDALVYEHRALTHSYKLLGSFAAVNHEDRKVVFATSTGIYETEGELPTPYDAVFNEFLIKEINKKTSETVASSVRLEWDTDTKRFFISLGYTGLAPLYSISYVMYDSLKKLGVFSEGHYGIFPIRLDSTSSQQYFWGYVNQKGQLMRWSGLSRRETNFSNSLASKFNQFPPEHVWKDSNGVFHFPQSQAMAAHSMRSLYARGTALSYVTFSWVTYEDTLENIPSFPDSSIEEHIDWQFASTDEDWDALFGSEDWNDGSDITLGDAMVMKDDLRVESISFPPAIFQGLNALIEIGLFRFKEQQYPDETSAITNMMVGHQQSDDIDSEFIDWNTIADGTEDEDWNALSGTEDWGEGTTGIVDFDLTVIGTNDGHTPYLTVTPVLQDSGFPHGRFYALNDNGVSHRIRFEALTVGQSLHLQSLEVSGTLTGRI